MSVGIVDSSSSVSWELVTEQEAPENSENVAKNQKEKYKMLTKVGIYSCELVRQASSIAAAIIGAVAGAAAACFGSAVTATILAFTGLMTTGVAGLQHSDLWEVVKAKDGKLKAAKTEFDQIAKNGTVSPALKAELEEAQRASTIATLAFANNCMFFGMGIGRLSTCVVTILERLERVAHLVVFSAGAATAFVALHAAASVVYFARGAFLVCHAEKNLTLINEFEKGWNALTTIEEKIAFLQKAEERCQGYLDLRLDRKCLDGKTTEGCKTPEDKVNLVSLVDKAIFSKKLLHKIGKASGALMMAGSILAAATLCVATGGIPFYVLTAVSALCFLVAEIHFITYYHPASFEKLRDKLFTPKVEIYKKPEVTVYVEEEPVSRMGADSSADRKPRDTWCPNLSAFLRSTYYGLGWAFARMTNAVMPEEEAS